MRIATTGKRFIVRAYEKLTAFLELEAAIRALGKAKKQVLTLFVLDWQNYAER
jgi:hypothetical protein